jgi:hypothetical protein
MKGCVLTMGKLIDITGKRFGRLVVLHRVPSHNAKSMWLCRCDCGNQKVILSGSLISGNTTTCGCLKKEVAANLKYKHGQAALSTITSEYRIWIAMKTRCYNPKHRHYKYYGGRGIKVCDRWLASFENFFADMGKRPSNKHSIDRYPNTDGNYEPGNCRWATVEEQGRNRTSNRKIVYRSQEMTIGEFIKALGIKGQKSTIYYQLTVRTPEQVAQMFQTQN